MRAVPLLAFQASEVLVADLMPAQINALVGEEVADRAEDVLAVLIRADVHQRAVDVEGDSGHSGQVNGHGQHAGSRRLDCRTSLPL